MTGRGDGPHDHGPHDSADPAWTDTWYWSAIDPDRQAVTWVHVSWRPARGTGQHVVTRIEGGQVERRRCETDEPLSSPLLRARIVEPWSEAHLACPDLGIDLRWRAFTEPVDFHGNLRVHDELSLRHHQGAGRADGAVGGRPFRGHGLRDRSSGPRDLRRIGRNWSIVAVGVERDAFVTANVMWPDHARLDDRPTISFGCLWDQGELSRYGEGITALRRRDASPGAVHLPGGPTVELDLAERYGESWLVLDPGSSPTEDLSDQPAYEMRSIYVPVSSPQLGRLVGWYGEGVLWIS